MAATSPRIHISVYTFTYNEEDMIEHFLRHYDFADRIVLHDNQSTDRTVELASADPRVEVRTFDTGNQLDCSRVRDLRDSCWKELQGDPAAWAIVVDMDEFLYYPRGIRALIREHSVESPWPTMIIPVGYNMVNPDNAFLDRGRPLHAQLQYGWPFCRFSKPVLFKPAAYEEIRYGAGGHVCDPVAREGHSIACLGVPNTWEGAGIPGFALLHYKSILGPHQYASRCRLFQARRCQTDLQVGYGFHYDKPYAAHAEDYRQCQRNPGIVRVVNEGC